jgi:hypothetical protein
MLQQTRQQSWQKDFMCASRGNGEPDMFFRLSPGPSDIELNNLTVGVWSCREGNSPDRPKTPSRSPGTLSRSRNAVQTARNAVRIARNAVQTARNAVRIAQNAVQTARNTVQIARNLVQIGRNTVSITRNLDRALEDAIHALYKGRGRIAKAGERAFRTLRSVRPGSPACRDSGRSILGWRPLRISGGTNYSRG